MVEKNKIKLSTKKIESRERRLKYVKFSLLVSSFFLIVIYLVLSIVYADGKFTINLDREFSKKTGMVIYEDPDNKQPKLILKVKEAGLLDNISIDWLPKDINKEANGTHNGSNYIAYTFYVDNMGSDYINYWYRIPIYSIIRNVDEAVRVMIYQNDNRKIYAKIGKDGQPEKNTTPFYSDDVVALEQRIGLEPGQRDKYTIVVWLEGDDPDCIDSIIGGQLKLNMELNQEFLN